MLPAASAAAALAQLHNHKVDSDWDSEGVRQHLPRFWPKSDPFQDWHSDTDVHSKAMRSIELPPVHHFKVEPTSAPYIQSNTSRPRELLPSLFATSPPGRSSTLPPLHRHNGGTKPRKQSLSKRAREPQHKRQKSRNDQAHLRRMSYGRDAFSAEPSGTYSVYGKRWEDLIDAATSATEDVEDRTPVSALLDRHSDHRLNIKQVPPSPISVARTSVPPFPTGPFQGYQASPLHRALTPPSYSSASTDSNNPIPFPSVETGDTSQESYHISPSQKHPTTLSDSSPSYSKQTQIYCAACQNVSLLKESYACTECICGICRKCVDVLIAEQGARRKCPRCATIGGRFKPFMLDIR
jgi:hypothetical protein